MADEVVTPPVSVAPPPDPTQALRELLDSLGGPSQSQVEQWKQQHGEVFVSAFGETEVYLWRSLKRSEYKELQREMADPEKKMDQFGYEEAICEKCTLWPKITKAYFTHETMKGGTATTLAEQIFQNSNFMTPQMPVFIAKL